ncbi:MAG: hypothetical protein AB2689_05545 [Candidatus Thiodiazotropha taylori]
MEQLWQAAIGLTGIAGVGSFVFFALYKEWITSPVLLGLNRSQKYRLLLLFVVLTFFFSLSALSLSAYQSYLTSRPITISFAEAERLTLSRYEYGEALLKRLIEDPSTPEEDLRDIQMLFSEYKGHVDVAKQALKSQQLLIWHEKSNALNALLRSDIAKKYIPEAAISEMVWDPTLNVQPGSSWKI